MSETKICPHCGSPLAEGEPPHPLGSPASASPPESEPTEVANSDEEFSMPLLAPGSNDETFVSSAYGQKLKNPELDPILGKFAATVSGTTSSVPVAAQVPQARPTRRSAPSGDFPTLNLNMAARPSAIPSPQASADDLVESEEESEEPRRGWAGVLIASYASAVTLALAWFVLKDRAKEKLDPSEAFAEKVEKPESPFTSPLSRKVNPPEPILAEHLASFGQPLRVGSLEVTPLEVKRQDVKLQRSSVLSVPERRDGGKKALVLYLKVKNVSEDAIFAPLDPAYLRDRGENLVDTFVTTADQEKVYPYKLAVESEWSIIGQDFKELRPGESRTVAIATAPDAPADTAGPFTWRVRLRTGIDRTDVIGLEWTPLSIE